MAYKGTVGSAEKYRYGGTELRTKTYIRLTIPVCIRHSFYCSIAQYYHVCVTYNHYQPAAKC